MTGGAIVPPGGARNGGFPARVRSVTAQALPPEPGGTIGRSGQRMRIVACAAPQPIARRAAARALRQVLDVAGHPQARTAAGSHEHGERVGQKVAQMVRLPVRTRAHHAHFAREMALRADRVAAAGIELGRIHDRRAALGIPRTHLRDVRFPGTVAPFASHATLAERRRPVAVLRARHGIEKTGMAGQAPGQGRPCQKRVAVTLVARRQFPF